MLLSVKEYLALNSMEAMRRMDRSGAHAIKIRCLLISYMKLKRLIFMQRWHC